MRSEFDFIQNIKSRYGLKKIGDDCAVLPKDDNTDMVITADMLVEDIDFRLDWTTPELLGRKALAVSLSDIAAMGGQPRWAILSIGVADKHWQTNFLDEFYEGFHLTASKFKVEIVGGDISRTPGKIVIDSTVIGDVSRGKAIMRSGAQPGDSIYVSGELGGAAAGLRLLQDGYRFLEKSGTTYDPLLLRHLEPYPQVVNGLRLSSENTASSMIDLSDGLSSDLHHIVEQSGVGARIYAERLPISSELKRLYKSTDEQLDMALNGGEDFELLFTADAKNISRGKLAGFYPIGDVTANSGIIELIHDGKTEILEPKGYRHF